MSKARFWAVPVVAGICAGVTAGGTAAAVSVFYTLHTAQQCTTQVLTSEERIRSLLAHTRRVFAEVETLRRQQAELSARREGSK